MVKRKIACYITGGWTECGYMTRFLEKINDSYDYRQRFPQKNVGKKKKPRTTHLNVNGASGQILLQKVYTDLEKHKSELMDYAAVLIEDDLDDRFFFEHRNGRDYDRIREENLQIEQRIRVLLEGLQRIIVFAFDGSESL